MVYNYRQEGGDTDGKENPEKEKGQPRQRPSNDCLGYRNPQSYPSADRLSQQASRIRQGEGNLPLQEKNKSKEVCCQYKTFERTV